jgi:NAD(P)H-dependent FMN reductase
MATRIVCLAGSARRDSLNKKLAREAAAAVREGGGEVIATQFVLPRAHQAFDADGRLSDTRSREQLAALDRRLLHVVRALSADQSRPV